MEIKEVKIISNKHYYVFLSIPGKFLGINQYYKKVFYN